MATRFDLRAILNASAQVGNPYRGTNIGYEVNAKLIPPMDTPIWFIIELAPKLP